MDVLTQEEQQVQPGPASPLQDDRSIRDGRPPLDSGDRLTRAEFERRYAARPDIKKEEGILRSRVFPGLWLHPGRFWKGDLAGVLAVLQGGLESPEHQAFVRPLRGEDQ